MPIDVTPEDSAVFARVPSTGRITSQLRHVMTREWNRCTVCGVQGDMHRPLFAGYDAEGQALLAHARCASTIIELATPVYWTEQPDISIADTQMVWRYMDFAKFVAMLQQQGLYFPRADQMDDKFEGAAGNASREAEWDAFYLKFFRGAVTTPPPGYPAPILNEDQIDREAKRLLSSIKASGENARSSLVSCWHANSGESEALWRLYCPPPIAGVAIRSTVQNLWNAMEHEVSAVVGRVHYVDFRKHFAGIGNDRLFFKRRSLSHENEVRIVIADRGGSDPNSRVIQCDLSALIEEIVISPFAPSWFHEVAANIASTMGLEAPCRQSDLLEQPFY